MRANQELLLKSEVYRIVGSALEVLNKLGHGLHEKPYENALVVEFQLSGIPFTQQPHYPIVYKGVAVGEYIPDLIAYPLWWTRRSLTPLPTTNAGRY